MDQLVDKIWDGELFNDETHLNTLHFLYKNNLEYESLYGVDMAMVDSESKSRDDFNQNYTKTTDMSRIEDLRRNFVWTTVKSHYFERFAKNAEISRKLLERATLALQNEKYKECFRGFSLAIAFGRDGEEELGLAFQQRALFFLKVNEPALAIQDIKLARENKCPEHLIALLQQEAVEMPKSKIKSSSLDDKSGRMNYFKLSCPSKKIQDAEYFVDIQCKEDRGRMLVVNKHVNAGEKILVEQPYVAVLTNLLKWDTEHCHSCYKPMLAGLPCKGCTFAFYCGKECRDNANSSTAFHRYEHNYLPYLHCIKTPLKDILASRIVCKIGPVELLRLFNSNFDSLNHRSDPDRISGFNSDGIYESSSYLPIYHLVSHPSHFRASELASNTFRALILTHLLEDTTDFFEKPAAILTRPHKFSEFRNFVASFILHHIENVPFSAISMSKLENRPTNVTKETKDFQPVTVPYAMAAFSLLSMCNHSCDPNAAPLRSPDSQTVSLIALKHIEPGEEIFISYGPLFTNMDTAERRGILKQRYNFECACIACVNDWYVEPRTRISKCAGTLTKDDTSRRQGIERKERNEIGILENKLREVEQIITDGNYLNAIKVLHPTLIILTNKFTSRFPLTLFAQDLLKKALVLLVNKY